MDNNNYIFMITFKEAIEHISKFNPVMGKLLHSDETLIKYVENNITSHDFDDIHLKRQVPYKELIKNKIDKLFPKEDIKINFDNGLIIDTTDHHNILNFPAIIGAHIISRFNTILDRNTKGDYFVLDSGNVTFSEVLNKRGINIGGKHINLYPKKDKNKLIARYPFYNFDFIQFAHNSGHKFNKREIGFLRKIQKIVNQIDFSSCERLSDQIVKINYYLWQEFFAKDIQDKVRKCITLEHDEILIKFLKTFLLDDTDNFIYKALFDENFRNIILKEFRGIYGAWNYNGGSSGTHFFWAFNKEDGKRYQMELVENKLICIGKKVRDVSLIPEDVIRALNEGILVPSIFIKFGLVGTWMGAKMMGGPGQTEYSVKLHDAWLKILKKYDKKEYVLANKVKVDTMNAGDLAFSRDENGDIFREWGFDIAMNHRFTEDYLSKLQNVKLKFLLYPVVPISYYRLALSDERQEIQYDNHDLFRGFDWVE